jgi:3-phosphoshikimate 1-carboxyvinyltransferase
VPVAEKSRARPVAALPARQALRGVVKAPGDKSVSHRALILGALASGRTRIRGLLESADVLATASVLRRLGARIERRGEEWLVAGCGVGGLRPSEGELDFGNSGTSVRLMMGVLAGHGFRARLTGDASLSRRPMGRALRPLEKMGLERIGGAGEGGERLPLELRGSPDLVPIRYELPVASAQVKSAIMLAGLHAPGETSVIEPSPTRDHTEIMMRHFGADVSVEEAENGENGDAGKGSGARRITVAGDAELKGCEMIVPGDPSSAAFPIAAALIVPGSEILVENVLVNPTRTGFFDTLLEMGPIWPLRTGARRRARWWPIFAFVMAGFAGWTFPPRAFPP